MDGAGSRVPDGGGTEAIVVVHPSVLLDALSGLFENLWERALPLPLDGTDASAPRAGGTAQEPEPADGRLLALLLLGLTDQAGARQLGVSHRTVQRRVSALLDELDARTRFQAGAQLALRGLPRRP